MKSMDVFQKKAILRKTIQRIDKSPRAAHHLRVEMVDTLRNPLGFLCQILRFVVGGMDSEEVGRDRRCRQQREKSRMKDNNEEEEAKEDQGGSHSRVFATQSDQILVILI